MFLEPACDPALILLLVMVAMLISVWTLISRSNISLRKRLILSFLRLSALLIVGILLLGFTREITVTPPEQMPGVVLALDHSRSMDIKDVKGRSRYAAARDELEKIAGQLSGQLRVERWIFADDARPLGREKEFPESATARPTNFGKVLELAATSNSSNPPIAIVLFSDGISTVRQDPLPSTNMLRSRRIILHAVPFGGKIHPPDLEIRTHRTRLVGFTGQQFILPVQVFSASLGAREVTVKLLSREKGNEGTEKVIRSQTVRLPKNGNTDITFTVSQQNSGYYHYRLAVDPVEGEFNHANNSLDVGLTILAGSIRVLLLEGAPHWDSKFFSQYALGDPHVLLTSIMRLRANKCFRVDEQGDRHDVVADDAIPVNADALGHYDIVVLGKGIDGLLDAEKALALQSFVKDYGGALFFLRGRSYNSYFPELAVLEPAVWGEGSTTTIRPRLTEIGRAVGAFHFGLNEPVADTLAALPELTGGSGVKRLRSFVDTHADFANARGQRDPLLLGRRFGKGTVLMFNAHDTWRWGFPPLTKEKYKDAYHQFFGMLLRWLATQADFLPGQDFLLRTNSSLFLPDEPVVFTLASRLERKDLEKYQPLIEILPAGQDNIVATLQPSPTGSKRTWSAILSLSEPGAYVARLHNNIGKPAILKVPFGIRPRRTEDSVLSSDPEQLRRLANAADGELLQGEAVAEGILENLASRTEAEMEQYTRTEPAWDTVWLLLLAAALWFAEWALRRWEGLA